MFSLKSCQMHQWRKKVRRMSYEEMYTYLKQVPKGTYAYTILTKRIKKLDKKAIKIFS